jgi:hypothetical protein
MKLPLEIRYMIIELMIDNIFRCKGITPAARQDQNTCNCPVIELGCFLQTPQMRELPFLFGPELSTEFFRILFQKKTIHFRCSCEMRRYLENNKQLLPNARQIKFHWCGPDSAVAFKLLSQCPKLESLSLCISSFTTTYPSSQTKLLSGYFPASYYRKNRIPEALGFDELLSLRGLREVSVNHAHSIRLYHTTENDRAGLARLLKDQLTKSKEVDICHHTEHARADTT